MSAIICWVTSSCVGSPTMSARAVPVLLGIICAILLLAALYFADAIFAPVACALFIIAIVWPLQNRLQTRLPQLLALAIVVALIVLVFTVFASVVAWGFGRIGRSLIAETPRLQGLYEQAIAWLETHGIAVAGLWAEHFNMRWVVGAMQGLSARLNTMISFWIVVLIYVLLGLLEVGPLARKIPGIVSSEAARILIVGSDTHRRQAAPISDDQDDHERCNRRHGLRVCRWRLACSLRRSGASSPSL